jgi:hypothetical protein
MSPYFVINHIHCSPENVLGWSDEMLLQKMRLND